MYLKADKGNAVVVLNKNDYVNTVENSLKNGPYKVLDKNPLNNYVRQVNNTLKHCTNIIDKKLNLNLRIKNPKLPFMYCLPKIHKNDNSYRPIVSNIDAPTYKISRWLANIFSNLSFDNDLSVKSSLDLIERLRSCKLDNSDRMVSFDVINLFPSIPIDITLKILEEFLEKNNIPPEQITEYLQLTDLCMNQNSFVFNNKFYKQNFGTSMGNPLSPFLANLFMNKLENSIKTSHINFLKVWYRYVDDVFAVVNENFDLNNFLKILNQQFSSIKFTTELDIDKKLPFLDLEITNIIEKLEYDIYRKKTHTNNYIPATSNTCYKYKLSAFNSLFHRLFNVPLSKQNFDKEKTSFLKQV